MTTDRRTQIADVALRLLGETGARGLTHRAVDTAAGLPAGSTSYYCRKRADLLALALARHAELEHAGLEKLGVAMERAAAGDDRLQRTARSLHRWITSLDSNALATRFELFLMASRDPQLTDIISGTHDRFVQTLGEQLKSAAVRQHRVKARAVIALVEGCLVDRMRLSDAALDTQAFVRAFVGVCAAPT